MSEEILSNIKQAVEEAVDKKINGKLGVIKSQLNEQDIVLQEVKELLKERTFLIQLWAFVKFLGGVVVALGSAFLIYKQLK